MPMAHKPTSQTVRSNFSLESREGTFIPFCQNFDMGIAAALQQECQDSSKFKFVEDEVHGRNISKEYAKYVEDCCHKRILNTELAK